MRKARAILFILIAGLITGLVSCAKKEGVQTPFTRLQGTWKLVKTATDDNGNTQIDPEEVHLVPAVQDNELTFYKDKTGVETNVYNGVASMPLHFDWAIVNDDSVWCAFTGHDTLTYYLVGVTSGTLTLQTNTSFGLAAYYYNRK
jgi:hypothetical protein